MTTMADPWALLSRAAAREAGCCTATILRIRHELDDLAELEAYGGETFAGATRRLTLAVAELNREVWRDVARHPARFLLPPVSLALMVARWRRG
jgi:hypothetical protein